MVQPDVARRLFLVGKIASLLVVFVRKVVIGEPLPRRGFPLCNQLVLLSDGVFQHPLDVFFSFLETSEVFRRQKRHGTLGHLCC